MTHFLNILNRDKDDIKMNNQTDSGFDLIFLTEKSYGKFTNILNYLEKRNKNINLAWEFKSSDNCFKLYKNLIIKEIKENFNPFKKKLEGHVVSFSCNDISYYSNKESEIGANVPKTTEKYKDTKILFRALKISNLSLDI
jgi:hypothetical protein